MVPEPGVATRGDQLREGRADAISENHGGSKTDALSRSIALEEELCNVGLDFEFLDRPPYCSLLRPALRACKSFVFPGSSAALALAATPGRAAVVAADVRRHVDDALAARKAWETEHHERLRVEEAAATPRHPLVLVLDGLRSTRNVGALLQTCAATRIAEVVLCGITPGPPDPSVLRAAGITAAASVPQRRATSAAAALVDLRARGYAVWALETTSLAIELGDLDPPRKLALVVGHEHQGVSVAVLDACDQHVCIATHGMKNSLNVAVAGSVAIFDVLRRWHD